MYNVHICIHNSPLSPDIGQNSCGDISDLQISGQSLIKENCRNSRARDDIDMKLGPVFRLDNGNKTKSKNFEVDFMSENCDVIVIFRIFGQFGAVRRPASRHKSPKKLCFQ